MTQRAFSQGAPVCLCSPMLQQLTAAGINAIVRAINAFGSEAIST
ncbi:hypothetical protein [Shewanella algae]|nr:hypothetical protein [Shewanella algae]MDV2962212.1 hypothetical protein [Shewanella algae]